MVRGKVVSSVLAPGVVVAAGAKLENSVVLADVTLASGCRVSYAVLDKEVGEGAKVEGKEDALALVGAGVELEAGQKLKAGVRLEPEHRESG